MNFITPTELKKALDSGESWQLIDIREAYEVESACIESIHIPMAEIANQVNTIKRDQKVVIYCKSGNRSKAVVNLLESEFGFNNLYSLEGGLTAWSEQVDKSLDLSL